MTAAVTFDHIDLAGHGVARGAERRLIVEGVFGGETARAEVVHRSKHHPRDVGRLVKITEPLASRRVAPCIAHATRAAGCGGCPLMVIGEEDQRDQKRRMLQAIGLTVDQVVETTPLGYRHSAKRIAFDDGSGLRLGSWARGTHEGAWMKGCLVDHPAVTETVEELEQVARALGVAAYDERTGEGELRYAWCKTNGQEVLLTLIMARDTKRAAELAERLERPTTIASSVQASSGNTIRGEEALILRGPPRLVVDIGGVRTEVGPLGFMQPNPNAIALAYRDLVSADPTPDALGASTHGRETLLAWDLYAGSGVTTQMLRSRFREVVPCERDPELAATLGVAPKSVQRFLDEAQDEPSLVICNPPRRGLGESVCAALIRHHPAELRIMSCGPQGLVKDIAALQAGGYALTSLRAYDTLPQTPHVELVAKLTRRA